VFFVRVWPAWFDISLLIRTLPLLYIHTTASQAVACVFLQPSDNR
jgi:hypothetical protein